MMTFAIALMTLFTSQVGSSTTPANILASGEGGYCMAKSDPIYQPQCEQYPVDLACNAYPFCIWIKE